MKIKFEPDLDFQAEALRSVCDVFEGQEICQTNFTVPALESNDQWNLINTDLGIGNRIRLLSEDVLANLNAVQVRNGLKPSAILGDLNFTIEMETGTGKTYVYLRSIFELNKRYGFTKFIIVVPSIAIKEGTNKALEMTEDHFRRLYDNVRYDFFVYDSQKLGQVRNFATSDCIQIMVINIDAFRRSFTDPSKESKANIIHRPHDRMMGAKPIEFIRDTHPIVIIDEPQSVDSTKKSAAAIASLNPLCTFRYSATHKDEHHPIFRLDSIDAYERKLVKQIEVAGITVEDNPNQAYIRLQKVDNRSGGVLAKVEIDTRKGGSIRRKTVTVKRRSDLCELSGGREVYDGYIVDDIYCGKGEEHITFLNRPETVGLGQAIGEGDEDEYKRLQIRKTIEEHLRKEKRLRPKGLKVLSLFFIDKVANYRDYDSEGNRIPGKYSVMFEEEYVKVAQRSEFKDLCGGADLHTAASEVHDGYFAIDKKTDSTGANRYKESRGDGTTSADGSAYELIMRDKERLLSFESKLKFIFSHTALREGWDNPNVFQICTLNETSSVMKKRQEIGRGLRIAVNQDGERVHDDGVNVLTVMANESYEEFAQKLQKEIEDDTHIRFGLVERHMFASIPIVDEDGKPQPLGVKGSEALWEHLAAQGYIDKKSSKVTNQLRTALHTDTLDLPTEFAFEASKVIALLKKVARDIKPLNADKRTPVRLNKERFLSEDFKDLWDKIKYRTTFLVDFDVSGLIETCAKAIAESPAVPRARFKYTVAAADVNRGGVEMEEQSGRSGVEYLEERTSKAPDILSVLQNDTNLTRRTLVAILKKADNLTQFKRNPTKYIEQVTNIIKQKMRTFIVDGIKYHKLGENEFYAQELFKNEELFGYLEKNMIEANEKSVYEHVIYDSEVEREFAKNLNASEHVKVFAKLPNWFKIETPLGSYNPDWAILINKNAKTEERLFFVVETKSEVLFDEALRPTEVAKIKCGKAHFEALGTGVVFEKASSYDAFAGRLG